MYVDFKFFLCYNFLQLWIYVTIGKSNEKAHVTKKFVHTTFKVNMIRMINLKEFKDMLTNKKNLDSMKKEERHTWYSLT
jgi:hypothetical protein